MTEADGRAVLKSEGFSKVNSWFESPDTEYEEHTHTHDSAYLVLEGMMTVGIEGAMHVYNPGDRFAIPAHVPHTTTFGPEGCLYLIGEK